MRYRPDLDGIRCLAVLAVLGAHSPLGHLSGGWVGVDIFFVLSGYLITALLLAEHEHTGTVRIRAFYARRALRLYPALILMIVAGLPFYRTLGDHGTITGYARTAATAALYLQDFVAGLTGTIHGRFAHTWSLGVEEQFYILWPIALILLLRHRRNPLPWALGGALLGWVALAAFSHQVGDFAVELPWFRFPGLLIGCAVAIVLARRTAPTWTRGATFGWGVVAAAALLVALLPTLTSGGPQTLPDAAWEIPAIVVLAAALLVHLSTGPGSVRHALGWRPLAYLGRRSYGIYLYHYPTFAIVDTHFHGGKVPRFAAEVAISIGLAIVSYRFVELPFLRMKQRLRPPSEAALPVGT